MFLESRDGRIKDTEQATLGWVSRYSAGFLLALSLWPDAIVGQIGCCDACSEGTV